MGECRDPASDAVASSSAEESAVPFVVVALAAACVLVGAIFVYAVFGGSWVRQLDEQIGELVARRARRLVTGGRPIEAVDRYRQALSVPFDDPRQRGYAQRELGQLLRQLGRPLEAVKPLRAAVSDFPEDGKAWLALCGALNRAEEWQALAEAARSWRAHALELERKEWAALASYHLGQACEALNSGEAALEAYRVGAEYDPSSVNAYHLGMLLAQTGQMESAEATLRSYLKYGTGWRVRRARDWLAQRTKGP